jgi:hypothetical protein
MKLIGRKVFSLLDMIHTLMGTNRRAFSLKPIFLKPYLRLRDLNEAVGAADAARGLNHEGHTIL